MKALIAALKKKLLNAKRIALLGVGSDLRGDDAAGILLAEELGKTRKGSGRKKKAFKVFLGHTAPENLTGEIKRFKPTNLIIVDSADIGKKAGQITIFKPEEISGASFCTHSLPIKIMADYLIESIGCDVTVIGIRPKSLKFSSPVSSAVKSSVKVLSAAIREAIK